MVIQTLWIQQTLSENEVCHFEEKLTKFVANDKMHVFKLSKKLEFQKMSTCHCDLDTPKTWNTFLMTLIGILTIVGLLDIVQ